MRNKIIKNDVKKQDWTNAARIAVTLTMSVLAANATLAAQTAQPKIIHDSEYYILDAQHGDVWAAQDKELDAKLAELRKKFGTPPNIIHIMWDDTAVREVGMPAVQKTQGWETPNINRLAEEGINFMRMYTEPSCTPSRGAVITGRQPIRNGMYNVGFPYEYGGLAATEVTRGDVLSKAGYATAFYGKAHLGDIEASYLNKRGLAVFLAGKASVIANESFSHRRLLLSSASQLSIGTGRV